MNDLNGIPLYAKLDDKNQYAVNSYIEFLYHQQSKQNELQPLSKASIPTDLTEVIALPRPENESVIKALKRLSKSYPMLDKSILLSKTSDFIGLHILNKQPEKEVIDDLEKIFVTQYETWLKSREAQ